MLGGIIVTVISVLLLVGLYISVYTIVSDIFRSK